MGHHGGSFRTVLLVEGDQDLARTIGPVLRYFRFVVTEVNTGREALDLLETQYPDAVILDLHLADGSGPALVERCRQIRQLENQMMVWVVVSNLDRAEAIKQYGPPIRNLLTKPFDPLDLVKLLGEELSSRAQALDRYAQRHTHRRARDHLTSLPT